MAAINYIDPKGDWLDPEGNIRRIGNEDGEQEVVATVTEIRSDAELMLLCKQWTKRLVRAGLYNLLSKVWSPIVGGNRTAIIFV